MGADVLQEAFKMSLFADLCCCSFADYKKIFLLSEETNSYIYYFLPYASKRFCCRLNGFQHQPVEKTWGSLKKC